jgi:hypothetical protein
MMKPCNDDLAALGLTVANIQALAGTEKFVDAPAGPIRAKMARDAADFMVSGVHPPQVWVDSDNFWQLEFASVLGTLVHELAHVNNGADPVAEKKLNVSAPSSKISKKLTTDCFSGVQNP